MDADPAASLDRQPLGRPRGAAAQDRGGSPTLVGRVAVALAVAAIVAYATAAVLFVLPVTTPGVQRCGAPGAYLLAGRIDVVPDEAGRVIGPDDDVVALEPSVAQAARDQPCRDRVAARAGPAAGLVAAATVIGLSAFALELVLVRPQRRRDVLRHLES